MVNLFESEFLIVSNLNTHHSAPGREGEMHIKKSARSVAIHSISDEVKESFFTHSLSLSKT